MHTNLPTALDSSPFSAGGISRCRRRALHAGPVLFAILLLTAFPNAVHGASFYDKSSVGPTDDVYQGASAITFTHDSSYGPGTYTLAKVRTAFIYFGSNSLTPFQLTLANDDGTGAVDCKAQSVTPNETGNAIAWGASPPDGFSAVEFVFTGTACTFVDDGTDSWQIKTGNANIIFLEDADETDNAYAKVEDGAGEPPSGPAGDGINDTHIIRINEPLSKTTSISNSIVIDFDYYTTVLGDPVEMVGYGVHIFNANTNAPVLEEYRPFPARNISAGVYNYADSVELADGSYSMALQAFVCDADGWGYGGVPEDECGPYS